MQRIAKVRIENFRACTDVTVDLDGFTPIVGPNNAGKSTILSALSWILSPSTLTDQDFQDRDSPVRVTITATGMSPSLLESLEEKHRERIAPYLRDETITVRRVSARPGMTAKSTVVEVRDPEASDGSESEGWLKNPTGLWTAISGIFPEPIRVGAMEDSLEDSTKSKTSTTLGKLLGELTEDVVREVSESYEKALAEVNEHLSAEGAKRPKEIVDFDKEASAAVATFFPGVEVSLHVPTPELKEILKSGTLATIDSGVRRDFSLLGHGAQRAIQMALIRVLADRRSSGGAVAGGRLLLIDEPELYLHPSAIYTLREALRQLSSVGYQVVVTTHSPILVEESLAASTVIVGKDPQKGTFARPTMRSVVKKRIKDAPHQAKCLFSLTHSSEILFSNRVVLAEGKTEQRLFPLLFREVARETMRSKGIALVDLGGVDNVANARGILAALGLESCVIADLDFLFRGAIEAGWIPSENPDVIACKDMIAALAAERGWDLDQEGRFKATGGKKAWSMYEEFAKGEAAQVHLANLAEELRRHDVWIWTRGAIEAHLGLTLKKEAGWAALSQKIQEKGLENAVKDPAAIAACVNWITSLEPRLGPVGSSGY